MTKTNVTGKDSFPPDVMRRKYISQEIYGFGGSGGPQFVSFNIILQDGEEQLYVTVSILKRVSSRENMSPNHVKNSMISYRDQLEY